MRGRPEGGGRDRGSSHCRGQICNSRTINNTKTSFPPSGRKRGGEGVRHRDTLVVVHWEIGMRHFLVKPSLRGITSKDLGIRTLIGMIRPLRNPLD